MPNVRQLGEFTITQLSSWSFTFTGNLSALSQTEARATPENTVSFYSVNLNIRFTSFINKF